MNKNKKWCIIFFIEFLIFIILIAGITIIVDPFFHYHKPASFLEYPLDNQRYQNSGILKNFKYDAIVTGTSMTENFKNTEVDQLFNVNSVKVPLSGASFKEINDQLNIATKSKNQKNIKLVIRGLDFSYIIQDKDAMKYNEADYPYYIYNNNLFDDTKYIFNKEVLFNSTIKVLKYTSEGKKTPTFDEYSYWSENYEYGAAAVYQSYFRTPKEKENTHLTEEEKEKSKANIEQNLVQIVRDNPNIEFYYFYTPYSIYFFDFQNNEGNLLKIIEAEKLATEMLLEFDNVKIFSFWREPDLITNMDNYKDIAHYGEWVNSRILKMMKEEKWLLTKENYEAYYKRVEKKYINYDYENLFDKKH